MHSEEHTPLQLKVKKKYDCDKIVLDDKKISRALVVASLPGRKMKLPNISDYVLKRSVCVCVQNVLISPVVFIIIEA